MLFYGNHGEELPWAEIKYILDKCGQCELFYLYNLKILVNSEDEFENFKKYLVREKDNPDFLFFSSSFLGC